MMSAHTALAADATKTVTLVAFGDSLTAGYMLKPSESFAAQLEAALLAKGHNVKVTNAGVSGDTTSGGVERLDWTLSSGADAVILELGANDALRGVDPKITRANLDKMLATLKSKGADVLIAGMRAPANWGDAYVKDFDSIYGDLAKKYSAPLYPFFLDGLTISPKFVMSDGLHPTADGVAEIVKRILPEAEALVTRAATRLATTKN